MKKIIGLLFAVLFSAGLYAQIEQASQDSMYTKDSLLFQYLETYRRQLREPCYELYPTENMWTFLKLNTATGQIWQVQYSVEGSDYRYETELSTIQRVFGDTLICGRFELHKTQNRWNFIMLDKIDGRCWQVQWSQDRDNRAVIRIY
ncbi:MAG: hypothetical protein U0L53_08430 [Bacteroidales bacterium]|nr:hypothetical protein [Bacteroidales bacterium]